MTTPHTPSAEAVRAAARQVFFRSHEYGDTPETIYSWWDDLDEIERKEWLEGALETLTAAFPHLRRQIIAECVRVVRDKQIEVYGPVDAYSAGQFDVLRAVLARLRALLGDATTREEGKT